MSICLVYITILVISPLLLANDNSQFLKYSIDSDGYKIFIFDNQPKTKRNEVIEFQAPAHNQLRFQVEIKLGTKECNDREKFIIHNATDPIKDCSTSNNNGRDVLKEACTFNRTFPSITIVTDNVAYLQICSHGLTEFDVQMRIYSQGNHEDSNILKKLQSIGINKEDCGKSKNMSDYANKVKGLDLLRRSMIIGGQEANQHSHPWMVYMKRQDKKSHSCGATLINHEWLLTAAHCVANNKSQIYDVKSFSLRLGGHYRKNDEYELGVEKIIIHEEFRDKAGHKLNDIGLIKLNSWVNYTEHVSPICLASNPKERLDEYDDVEVIITGWGLVGDKSDEANDGPRPLKEALVKTIGNYHKNINKNIVTYKKRIYIFKQDARSCQGDSGGPMLLLDKDNEHYIQYGVFSGMFEDNSDECTKDKLAFYLYVPKYIKWISEHLK